ncbi:MAG: VanZ family protein [Cyclobacteriaceae bacterium]
MKYATVAASLLIIIAVLIPGRDLRDVNIGGYDKLIHVAMFAVWAVAVRYDFDNRPFNFPVAFIAGISFSALTEILQLFVEGRSFDTYDMLADAVGLIIGLWISRPLLNLIERIRR